MDRQRIYAFIDAERQKQDEKWGPLPRNLSMMTWLTILMEEVGECAQAILKHDLLNLCVEIIQVAAVAVAWYEDTWVMNNTDEFWGGKWKVG